VRELIQFWGARLDETESDAVHAYGGHNDVEPHWHELWSGALALNAAESELIQTGDALLNRHIERHDPARVLADVAAKRKLLDAYAKATANQLRHEDAGLHLAWTILGLAVRTLAEAHDQHPDYQEEWRP
jgi:hypothetical protein